jgi:hypothetical protein
MAVFLRKRLAGEVEIDDCRFMRATKAAPVPKAIPDVDTIAQHAAWKPFAAIRHASADRHRLSMCIHSEFASES